jgi:signal transduction histidine kinase
MSLQVRRQLFLMFKECIHNVARHSHCTAVVAALRATGREIVLTVEDNGVGSNGGAQSARRAGTGIAGMQRRAERLGGRMQMTSAPGGGYRVEIRLPC